MSNRFTLNTADLRLWLTNFLIFSAPIILVGLIALQNGVDYRIAGTMVGQAFLTALIDLTRRFISKGT